MKILVKSTDEIFEVVEMTLEEREAHFNNCIIESGLPKLAYIVNKAYSCIGINMVFSELDKLKDWFPVPEQGKLF